VKEGKTFENSIGLKGKTTTIPERYRMSKNEKVWFSSPKSKALCGRLVIYVLIVWALIGVMYTPQSFIGNFFEDLLGEKAIVVLATAATLLVLASGAVWVIWPRRKKFDGPSVIASIVLATGFSVFLAVAPVVAQQAPGQQTKTMVQVKSPTQNIVVEGGTPEMAVLIANSPEVKKAIDYLVKNGGGSIETRFTLVEGMLVVIVVSLLIAGYYYIKIKLQQWGFSPRPSTNSLSSRISSTSSFSQSGGGAVSNSYGAVFAVAVPPFRGAVSNGSSVGVVLNLPLRDASLGITRSKQDMTVGDFLAENGLGVINMPTYSVNGFKTNSSSVISLQSGTITITVPGGTNYTTTEIQLSDGSGFQTGLSISYPSCVVSIEVEDARTMFAPATMYQAITTPVETE